MKITLPAQLMEIDFVYNGELAGNWERPPAPAGKVHMRQGASHFTRCGMRAYRWTPWHWKVRTEHVCKRCIKDWLHGDPNQIEVELK